MQQYIKQEINKMDEICIEILESEVDELLALLYAVDAPLVEPATPPLAEQVANRIIQAVVEVVDQEGENGGGNEADAFGRQIEILITNLKNRCEDVPGDAYAEGQLSAYNYALALYREHQEADTE